MCGGCFKDNDEEKSHAFFIFIFRCWCSGQLGRGKPPVLRPDPHSRNYDTLAAHTFHLTPQPVQFGGSVNGVNGAPHIHAIGCGSYHGLCASREHVYVTYLLHMLVVLGYFQHRS